MRSNSVLMIIAAVAVGASGLGGCGRSSEAGASDAGKAAADASAARSALAKLSAEAQATVNVRTEQLRQELASQLQQAGSSSNRLGALADFAQRRVGYIEQLNTNLPKLEEVVRQAEAGQVAQPGAVESARTNLAIALQELSVQKAALGEVLKSDPVISAAYDRLLASPAPKPPLSVTVAGLAYEPCAFTPAGKVGEAKFTLSGVSLGMTKAEVLGAVCAMSKGAARQLADGVVIASERREPFRWAGFDARTTRLKELPWTLGREWPTSGATDPIARDQVARPFMDMQFCFNCAPVRPGAAPDPEQARVDGLFVRLSPDGKVVFIERTQKFQRLEKVDLGNGQFNETPAAAPRPYKEVMGPYEARFGLPSYMFSAAPTIGVGWVFPDRKAPLRLEHWYEAGERYNEYLELNSDGLVTERRTRGSPRMERNVDGQLVARPLYVGVLDKQKLMAQKPAATYCTVQHGMARVSNERFGVPGSVDDAARSAPGYIERCGVLVGASVQRAARPETAGEPEFRRPPGAQTPIYAMSVRIMDTDAFREAFVRQEREAREKVPGRSPG